LPCSVIARLVRAIHSPGQHGCPAFAGHDDVIKPLKWLLIVGWLTAGPAAAQTLAPGYDDRPARGSAEAKGVVIYSPGLAREGDPIDATPYVLDDFQEAGWDVVRFLRPRSEDTLEASIRALAEAVGKLRGDGYKRVVLAGQSFGGWISLAVRPEPPVDAVVALAPAAFGRRDESPTTWEENAAALYPLAETVTAGRVLVFLFQADAYDPGGRGERLRAIFDHRQVAAAVVDKPAALAGHNAGLTRAFARRFGPCIRDYIEIAEIQTGEAGPLFVCPEPTAARLAPLTGADATAVADAEPGAAELAGRWYGTYPNGRDVLFVVSAPGGAALKALYAFGEVIRGVKAPAGQTQRQGTFDAATGVARFAEPQAENVIECRLLADDVMLLAIANRARGEPQGIVLRRVEAR